MKVSFVLEFDTESGKFSVTNTETGEVQDVNVTVKKATSSKKTKKKEEESTTPQLILEDNKYTLNTAAVELMGVEPDDRLCIKYKKVSGNKVVPVIGTEAVFGTKGGNKLTKTNTVSCRGKANEELSAYGHVFELGENPDGTGTFLLSGDAKPVELPKVEDEAIDIEDEEINSDLQEIKDSVSADSDNTPLASDELDSFLNELD